MIKQMENKHPIIWGTIILTVAGLLSRLIGFFYRIFLSQTIGAEGMGIYQLIFPIYTLCFAITIFGIQTAISRFVAADMATDNPQGGNDTFILGTALSLLLSLIIAGIVRHNSEWIALHLLRESRTAVLLSLLSYSIPMASLHTCVNAYYYALKKTTIPAISQLIEQVARVGASYIIYQILLAKELPVNAWLAVAGIVAGELAAIAFSLMVISYELHKEHYQISNLHDPLGALEKIFTLSIPLTGNRLLITLLHSGENILIPSRLMAYGLNSSDALSLFGVLSGMSLPLLLFPSTITNSVAVMLLPSVAELQALGKQEHIIDTVKRTIKACMGMGILFMVIFFFMGPFLGSLFFKNQLAGKFLQILSFICPFLYLNTTLMSILNGMGKTLYCFIHNSISLGLRLLFVIFAIPKFSIKGYLWGVLVGELVLSVLNFVALRRILYRQKI